MSHVAFIVMLVMSLSNELETSLETEFHRFVNQHNRKYKPGSVEFNARREIFKQNGEYIRRHNSQPGRSFSLAMNHWGDWSQEEIQATPHLIPGHPPPLQQDAIVSLLELGTQSGVPTAFHHHGHHHHIHTHSSLSSSPSPSPPAPSPSSAQSHHTHHHHHPHHNTDESVLQPNPHAREHAIKLASASEHSAGEEKVELTPEQEHQRAKILEHLQKHNQPDIIPSYHIARHLHHKHHHKHSHEHKRPEQHPAVSEHGQPPITQDETNAQNSSPPDDGDLDERSVADVLNRAVSPIQTHPKAPTPSASPSPQTFKDYERGGQYDEGGPEVIDPGPEVMRSVLGMNLDKPPDGFGKFELELDEHASRPEDRIRPEDDDRYFEIPPLDLLLPSDAQCPPVVDWRTKNVLSEVMNQGNCGACYAFITAQAIESALAIHTGALTPLSSQQLIDCSGTVGNHGCVGGGTARAMTYVIQTNGLMTAEEYPFEEKASSCRAHNDATLKGSISGYVNVSGGNETLLQFAVSQNPVATSVDAHHQSFLFYSSGVYNDPECTDDVTHGTLIVGYGVTSTGMDYWIIRNSWSDVWGMGGYMLLARNADNKCGIATEAYFPVLTHP